MKNSVMVSETTNSVHGMCHTDTVVQCYVTGVQS